VEERIFEYLSHHYERLGIQQQRELLGSIIDRLAGNGFLRQRSAMDIIRDLEEEEKYSMSKILAYLDMLDLEERS